MWIDLELLKQHCRADDSERDDNYLQAVLESAEEWVRVTTHRTAEELEDMGGGQLPKPLRQAVLLIAGHWYNQREAVGTAAVAEVPYTVSALIKPYIKLVEE